MLYFYFSSNYILFAVHEGEKNHVCHCGKAFFNKGVMKEHIKAGMGVNILFANLCYLLVIS